MIEYGGVYLEAIEIWGGDGGWGWGSSIKMKSSLGLRGGKNCYNGRQLNGMQGMKGEI